MYESKQELKIGIKVESIKSNAGKITREKNIQR